MDPLDRLDVVWCAQGTIQAGIPRVPLEVNSRDDDRHRIDKLRQTGLFATVTLFTS
jgi:hypothetical protein